MTTKRTISILALATAFAAAACGQTAGSPATSASPAAPASEAPASAAPSAESSASASAAASPSAAASADTGGDLAALIPATVGDIALSSGSPDAAGYVAANVNRQLTPILEAVGKTPADVTVVTSTGAATGATLFLDVVRVAGADASAMLTAFAAAAGEVPGATLETVDVAGRTVNKVTTGSYTLAVTGVGDTLVYVQSPDPALIDQALAALPA